MNMPLDIAVDIGRIVTEMQTAARGALNLACCAEELESRHPESGVSRRQILDALRQEAGAVGLLMN